jgi:hypothetical protein
VTGRVTIPGGLGTVPVFLPNGNIMIPPWGVDPAVYIWDPSATRAVEFACRAVGRDLTEAEWVEHFPGRPYRKVCPSS